MTSKISLERFDKEDYDNLISWVENEQALMQFAGPLFKFPLTAEQLDVSLSDKNRIAFKIVNNDLGLAIGHAEVYLNDGSAKIGRILIGDKAYRGKGLCGQIVALLLDFAFTNLERTLIELNVFDWNICAIKCYEKAGFSINPDKKLERKIKDETWTAINMTINKSAYEQQKTKL